MDPDRINPLNPEAIQGGDLVLYTMHGGSHHPLITQWVDNTSGELSLRFHSEGFLIKTTSQVKLLQKGKKPNPGHDKGSPHHPYIMMQVEIGDLVWSPSHLGIISSITHPYLSLYGGETIPISSLLGRVEKDNPSFGAKLTILAQVYKLKKEGKMK